MKDMKSPKDMMMESRMNTMNIISSSLSYKRN